MASLAETCTRSIGTSKSSASEMARCVASRSTTNGRDAAWNFAAVMPFSSSRSVSQPMQSEFSAWIISIACSRRAAASESRIWRSVSFTSS